MEGHRQDYRQYVISANGTIEDTLRIITEDKRGAAIVVDDAGRLAGIVSDGDIRRALLRGATVFAPIEKVMNRNVLSVTEESTRDDAALWVANPGINLIPVVDKNNLVIGVLVRGGAV